MLVRINQNKSSLWGKHWPPSSVHRWRPQGGKEALQPVCSAPPAPCHTHCPERCSSPWTLPCGSGKSCAPARNVQTSSWPHGSWWCRSRSGRTPESAQATMQRNDFSMFKQSEPNVSVYFYDMNMRDCSVKLVWLNAGVECCDIAVIITHMMWRLFTVHLIKSTGFR